MLISQGPIYANTDGSFDFDIPADAQVSGIQVEAISDSMYLYGCESRTSRENIGPTGIFGHESDNWGVELTPKKVNDISCCSPNARATAFYNLPYNPPKAGGFFLQRRDMEEYERQCGELILRRIMPLMHGQIFRAEDDNNDPTQTLGNNITLYVSGPIPDSGNITLFVHGHSTASSIPPDMTLFTEGHSTASGLITLYTAGHATASSIPFNLYLKGPTDVTASGQPTLFVDGTPVGTGTIQNNLPLFVEGLSPTGNFNLFIKADTPTTGIMNLYISGAATSVNSGMSLYLANSGLSNTTTLMVEGTQLTIAPGLQASSSGWIPATGLMNLYIHRPPEGCISMFVHGSTNNNSGIPLFVANQLISASSVSMAMPNIYNSGTKWMSMYTHGNSV